MFPSPPPNAKGGSLPSKWNFCLETTGGCNAFAASESEQNQKIQVQQQQKPALPEQPLVGLFIYCGEEGDIFLMDLMHASAPMINSTVLPDFMVSLKAVLQWKDDTSYCQTQENYSFGQEEKGEGNNRRKLENMKMKGWL